MNKEDIIKKLQQEIDDDKCNWKEWYGAILRDMNTELIEDLYDMETSDDYENLQYSLGFIEGLTRAIKIVEASNDKT